RCWATYSHVALLSTICQVTGAATITSQSLRGDSAEVQLVAGSISRARAAALRPQLMLRGAMKVAGVEEINVAPSEESVGETHVYQLPARISIEPGTPVTTALFPRSGAAYTQELIVPGALPWRGFPGQAPGDEHRVPV